MDRSDLASLREAAAKAGTEPSAERRRWTDERNRLIDKLYDDGATWKDLQEASGLKKRRVRELVGTLRQRQTPG